MPRGILATSNGVSASQSLAPRKIQRQSEGAQIHRQYVSLGAKYRRGEISQVEFSLSGIEMRKMANEWAWCLRL